MCEDYFRCLNLQGKKERPKALTVLLLDCWQREYDKRPYRNFVLKILEFEERMGRNFHPLKDFRVLGQFLNSRNLHSVSITGLDGTTDIQLEKLFAAGMINLRRLELKMTKLPDCFWDQLAANADRMYLRELNLEGTKLSYIAILDLNAFLIKATHLNYFNVTSCGLCQTNFAILADGVHKCPTVRTFICNRVVGPDLTMDSQKFSHTISSLIWQNKLEKIEIQHSNLNAQDMEVLSEYLCRDNSVLRNFNVACNTIGSDGAEYLFQAISKSGTLTHLDLSCCGLGNHGGDVVAKYLSSCFSLVSLNLRCNDIGAAIINNILTMFKKRIPMMSLKVFGNHFDDKTAKIVDRLLRSRVLPRDNIDITVTYEEDLDKFRVVPYF